MARVNALCSWMSPGARGGGWAARLRVQARRENSLRGTFLRRLLCPRGERPIVTAADRKLLSEQLGDKHEAFLQEYVPEESRELLRF